MPSVDVLEAVAGAAGAVASRVPPLVSYGPIALHLDTDDVMVGDRPMPRVRGILYRLLRYMVLHPEGPITHELLERDVWRAKIATKTVESHLSRLRSALGPAGPMIVTLPQGCALTAAPALAEITTTEAGKVR